MRGWTCYSSLLTHEYARSAANLRDPTTLVKSFFFLLLVKISFLENRSVRIYDCLVQFSRYGQREATSFVDKLS